MCNVSLASAAELRSRVVRLQAEAHGAVLPPFYICLTPMLTCPEHFLLTAAHPMLQAFDGSVHTKWLDFGGAGNQETWLEYALGADRQPVAVASYELTSANDSPERDPKNFILEGALDGSGTTMTHDLLVSHNLPRHQRSALLYTASWHGHAHRHATVPLL